MKFIGLIGSKGAGKTTAFEAMKEFFPKKINEVTLAKKLKDVSAEVFEISRECFDKAELKEKAFSLPIFLSKDKLDKIYKAFELTDQVVYDKHYRFHIGTTFTNPRQIAQYVGSELLRVLDPNIHCKFALEMAQRGALNIVTDMRFPNEFEFFSNYEGAEFFSIYIQNPSAETLAKNDSHDSEAYTFELAKKASLTIKNDKSLQEFRRAIKTLAKSRLD